MGFILGGGFWALFGLGMLITGSVSIPGDWIVLSKRHARIAGAVTMVLGLIIVSIGILPRPEWFGPREIALGEPGRLASRDVRSGLAVTR